MPTVEVNNWSSIVRYLQDNTYASDEYPVIIKLTADIDMNSVAPTGISSISVVSLSYGYKKILDLNGHTIKNLRTSTTNPQSLFIDTSYGTNFEIKNGDFVNLVCSEGDFAHFYKSNSSKLAFTNVRIVGFRTGNAYLFNQGRTGNQVYLTLDRCYIDFPWYGANSSDYSHISLVPQENGYTTPDAKATYCWFHETHGGWSVPVAGSSRQPMTSCGYMCLDGCYVDGEVKLQKEQNGSSIYYNAYNYIVEKSINYNAATPNVIDINWSIGGGGQLNNSFAYTNRMNALFKKPTSGVQSQYAVSGSLPTPVFATAEQMTNVEWLRSQGFPVIEPTT